MKTKHTWGYDGNGVNDRGNEYAPRIATLSADYNTREIGNLIAAAPEMLDVVENAEFLLRKLAINPREIGRMTDSLKRTAGDMRAAIAKATGES